MGKSKPGPLKLVRQCPLLMAQYAALLGCARDALRAAAMAIDVALEATSWQEGAQYHSFRGHPRCEYWAPTKTQKRRWRRQRANQRAKSRMTWQSTGRSSKSEDKAPDVVMTAECGGSAVVPDAASAALNQLPVPEDAQVRQSVVAEAEAKRIADEASMEVEADEAVSVKKLKKRLKAVEDAQKAETEAKRIADEGARIKSGEWCVWQCPAAPSVLSTTLAVPAEVCGTPNCRGSTKHSFSEIARWQSQMHEAGIAHVPVANAPEPKRQRSSSAPPSQICAGERWLCPSCGGEDRSGRLVCTFCGAPKPVLKRGVEITPPVEPCLSTAASRARMSAIAQLTPLSPGNSKGDKGKKVGQKQEKKGWREHSRRLAKWKEGASVV